MSIPPLFAARHRQGGFTMIEIAIVILVISGLLAGFFSYKEILRTVRLKKVAAEVQSFGVAARTFDQKYDALPGDYLAASDNLPGCEVTGITASNPYGNSSNVNNCRNGNGDGIIGRYCHFMWPSCLQTGNVIPPDPDGNAVDINVAQETTQFWKHLLLAGMITGIIDPHYQLSADPRWGVSHPESAVWDSGYVVSGQGGFIGGSVDINFVPTPTYDNGAVDKRTMSVLDAHYLDQKFDNDGAGSGAIWWNPVTNDGSGCRKGDGGPQNTWENVNTSLRNCTFIWTVY